MTLSRTQYKNQDILHSFLFSSKSSVYFTLQDIQIMYFIGNTGAHRFIVLCRFCVFYKLNVCGNPALSDSGWHLLAIKYF